jgi:6-phosphofructokinase 2
MVGGIAVGLARGSGVTDAVRLGIAAATAALSTPGTSPGLSTRIEAMYRSLAPIHDVI